MGAGESGRSAVLRTLSGPEPRRLAAAPDLPTRRPGVRDAPSAEQARSGLAGRLSPLGRQAVVPGEGTLPVLPALAWLLPGESLRRGTVVAAGGWGLLCLALVSAASVEGAWCAVVGLPQFGVRAAAETGVDLDRVLLVPAPGPGWAQVVATLLDACEIVLLDPPERPPAGLRRKLEAVARRFGSVLVVAGEWEGAQTKLFVDGEEWAGIGVGRGRLRARQARIVAAGRSAGSRLRTRWLWLPGPDGTVTPAAVAELLHHGAAESGSRWESAG